MAEVEISYKGSNIATMNASGTKTLLTEAKYLEDDVTITYARPSAPSGTKQISITQNGTTTEDVTNYASAEITANVPNTYSAGDEGKVVSNGALVAQTSDTVTTNDTYDTTLISSLTVNVSGGGGTNFGVTNTNTLAEMFYAIEHNMYSTGVITVASYFPKSVESELFDTGYDGNLRGVVIFNEQGTASGSSSGDLYQTIGWFGQASQGADQSASNTSSFTKYRGGSASSFLVHGTPRVNSGKVYFTPSNAGTTNTVFHINHTYRWIAWTYDIIPN